MEPKTTHRLEIRVEVTNYASRRMCLFCGEQTNDDTVVAEVYENGERTGYVVCPDYPARAGCISASGEVLAERLRKRAACARAEAEDFENIAADLPVMPTSSEYQAVEDAYMLERCGGRRPIGAAVNEDGNPF